MSQQLLVNIDKQVQEVNINVYTAGSSANIGLIIEYSIDGTTGWHYTATNTDNYFRISIDDGVSWGESLKFKGNPGESTPVNLKLRKEGANGITYPTKFKWVTNLIVSSIELLSNCSDISVTIGSTTYTKNTLPGIVLYANTEITINDITISAGYSYADVIIIFSQI